MTYTDITPSLIENTTMKKGYNDEGVHKIYCIIPIEGYVLHDKRYDDPVIDEGTLEETGEVNLGYRTSEATCPASYDFDANPWEFYAVPENSVPADRIFGGGNNNHEVS